jgi:predicted SprT family Zn-dependent metalloprotease
MTAESDDDIMDSLFHGCALAAYVDQAIEQQGRPDSVATRQRAYDYYEAALAEKNRRKSAALLDSTGHPANIVSYDTKHDSEAAMVAKPTRTYSSLDAAYDHFNRELFGGLLPPCLITMQRHKGAYGYFSRERFASLDTQEVTDEIALNPAHFASRTPTQTLSTLVHEMVHLWQHHGHHPSRNGYHNKEWATKMREVGLIPSSTGQPGGQETGQRVSHYIEDGGRFDQACTAYLATAPAILYHDRAGNGEAATRKKKAASKTKYTCPGCGQNAWAKPEAKLICGECEDIMEAGEMPGEGDDSAPCRLTVRPR